MQPSSPWWQRAQSQVLGFPLFPGEVLGGVSDPKGMSRLGESSKCLHVTHLGSCPENSDFRLSVGWVLAALVLNVEGGAGEGGGSSAKSSHRFPEFFLGPRLQSGMDKNLHPQF